MTLLRTLKRGQDVLGDLHDRQTLVDDVGDAIDSRSDEDGEIGALRSIVQFAEAEIADLHCRYVRAAGQAAGRRSGGAQSRGPIASAGSGADGRDGGRVRRRVRDPPEHSGRWRADEVAGGNVRPRVAALRVGPDSAHRRVRLGAVSSSRRVPVFMRERSNTEFTRT